MATRIQECAAWIEGSGRAFYDCFGDKQDGGYRIFHGGGYVRPDEFATLQHRFLVADAIGVQDQSASYQAVR